SLFTFSVCLHLFALYCVLLSFPTRRSSDLTLDVGRRVAAGPGHHQLRCQSKNGFQVQALATADPRQLPRGGRVIAEIHRRHQSRSEEHTSELQSRFDLVCRLLLEKKKSL